VALKQTLSNHENSFDLDEQRTWKSDSETFTAVTDVLTHSCILCVRITPTIEQSIWLELRTNLILACYVVQIGLLTNGYQWKVINVVTVTDVLSKTVLLSPKG